MENIQNERANLVETIESHPEPRNHKGPEHWHPYQSEQPHPHEHLVAQLQQYEPEYHPQQQFINNEQTTQLTISDQQDIVPEAINTSIFYN